LVDIKIEIFRWGLQMNETGTVERALTMYHDGVPKSSSYFGVVLEAVIRFGVRKHFDKLFCRPSLDEVEILALAAVSDFKSQTKVLHRYKSNRQVFGKILSQMLNYGSPNAIWRLWSSSPFPFNDLELLVVQLSAEYLKEAMYWKNITSVALGLERRVSTNNILCPTIKR
jgi:hypothetical protein